MTRTKMTSGAPWEEVVGYSRAIRVGNTIEISGTTAVDGSSVVGVDDPAKQTRFILNRISAVLQKLESSLNDVVRTRMYVTDINHWEEIGNVHGEFFRDVKPAATMVEVAKLIRPELLVEIEVTAIVE